MQFKRRENENEYEYIYRLGASKELIGTWQDVADILNAELGYEYTESRYRKMYQAFSKMVDGNQARLAATIAPADDAVQQKLALEKERVRVRDERGELNRVIRQQARADSILEAVHEAISTTVPPMPGYTRTEHHNGENDLIVHLTDIHAGLQTKNFANQYDPQIMRARLAHYSSRICQIQALHQSENCYLLLGGDLISGLIHSNLRLENSLNVMQQVMVVSAAVCEFISGLSASFKEVHIYSVPGNHSRCLPRKEDNLKGENLDILVTWYLQAALKEYRNVVFHENDTEESVAIFFVRNQAVFGVHGDKDQVGSVVQTLTMFFKRKPDIVFMGHRHVNGMSTVYDTKIIESGCVSGPDNYCMDHRLCNRPEQSVAVINDQGLECLYNVCLDEV